MPPNTANRYRYSDPLTLGRIVREAVEADEIVQVDRHFKIPPEIRHPVPNDHRDLLPLVEPVADVLKTSPWSRIGDVPFGESIQGSRL